MAGIRILRMAAQLSFQVVRSHYPQDCAADCLAFDWHTLHPWHHLFVNNKNLASDHSLVRPDK